MSDCKNKKKCLDCEQGLTTKPPINTISCEETNPCSTSTLSQCVIYNGLELTCNDTVISESGDNLNTVLASFLELICSSTSNITIDEILCSENIVITEGSTIQEAFDSTVSYFCERLNNLPEPEEISADVLCGEDIVVSQGAGLEEAITGVTGYFCERLNNINLNLIIDTTYSELQTLIAESNLEKGKFYHNTENGVILQALETNVISTTGERVMRIVKNLYYTPDTGILGVWNSNVTPTVGDVAVWGGKVWENTTGNVGTFTDDTTLDPTDWVLIPTTNDTYYFTKSFGCTYDIVNDWVSSQWDDRGNFFTLSWVLSGNFGYTISPNDFSDWGNEKIFDNTCFGIYNNSNSGFIGLNSNGGAIYNNSNSGGISNNSNIGSIFDNSNTKTISGNSNSGNINNNSNGGGISNNSNIGSIFSNLNGGSISNNSNGGIIFNNSNTESIANNSNVGQIASNSNTGIYNNSNGGVIESNSNTGAIFGNLNAGQIAKNSNSGGISNNSNIGNIDGIASDTTDIQYNTNNGGISTTVVGSITDPIVNK